MPRHYRHAPWQDQHPHDDLPPIRHVGVGHGVRWISEGWSLFLARPGFWLLAALLQTLLILLVLLVPVLGQVGAHLLIPIMSAGLMVVAQRVHNNEPVTVEEAFTGFREHAPAVVNIGVWYMLGWMLIVALGLLLGGGAALSGLAVGMETHYEWLGTLISVFGILLAYLSNFIINQIMGDDLDKWRWMLGVMAVPSVLFVLLFHDRVDRSAETVTPPADAPDGLRPPVSDPGVPAVT